MGTIEKEKYEKILKEEEALLLKYAKLTEDFSCGCGSGLLSDVHKESCIDVPDKTIYKELAKILYDIVSLGNLKQYQLVLVLKEMGIKGDFIQIS